MGQAPSADNVEAQLRLAVGQFLDLQATSGQVADLPLNWIQRERTVRNMLEGKDDLLVAVPALGDIEKWVSVHWDPDRQTRPPAGTVSILDEWGHSGEAQLDDLAAACNLLLAATMHGVETVTRCAVDFATYGMIEVQRFFLLKGPPVSSARSLDDYCNLLPYPEALQKLDFITSEHSSAEDLHWPPESADNVCVLEARSYERRSLGANRVERHISPLLQCGPEILTLILGLVWGTGFRVFGNWHGVAESVDATLPFSRGIGPSGKGIHPTALLQSGFRRPSTNRPLNIAELLELVGKFDALPGPPQRVLHMALRRLRDGTERMELEDQVVDVCIALEALFMEGEQWNQKKTVSQRGSWFFADSQPEREESRSLLKEFYDQRSFIVHSTIPENLTRAEEDQRWSRLATLTVDIEDLARASLKAMIAEGRPQDWEDSKDARLIRQNPPRAETDIRSEKSDSMSWTMAEQREIDQALEAVWKPDVENAPRPPPDAVSHGFHGINADEIERCRAQGIPFVISVPIRLYMAHPKWPRQECDPLDDRIKYYCHRDVARHLEDWQKAAAEKRMQIFELPLESPETYRPETFERWRASLERGGLT